MELDYFFSLGTCCQQLGEHEEAIFCFGRAGIVNIEDPRSPYYAGKKLWRAWQYSLCHQIIAALRICDCHGEGVWTDVKDNSHKALANLTQEVCYEQ